MQIHIIKHKPITPYQYDQHTHKVVIIDAPLTNPHSQKVKHIFDLYSNHTPFTFIPLHHNDYSTLTSIFNNIPDKANTILSLSIAWQDNIQSISSILQSFYLIFTAYSLNHPYPSHYPFTYSVSKYSSHNPDISIPVPDTYFHHLKGNSAIAPLATALFVSNQLQNDSFATINENPAQDDNIKPLYCKTCLKIIKDNSLSHCPHCNQPLN